MSILSFPKGTVTHGSTITFRGEEKEITWTHEGDGIFCWHFDGITSDEWDALQITDKEEDEVQQIIYKHHYEMGQDYD